MEGEIKEQNDVPPPSGYLPGPGPGPYPGPVPNYLPPPPIYSQGPSYQGVPIPVGPYPPSGYVPQLQNYSSYSPPVVPPAYSPPGYQVPPVAAPAYSTPPYPVPLAQTYPTPAYTQNVVVQPAAPYSPAVNYVPQANYSSSGSLQQYLGGAKLGLNYLNPFIPIIGYLPNHWTNYYFRVAPYRVCPKNLYLAGPTSKDIADAFAYANQVLQSTRGQTINYLNSTQHSFAARHQVFSFLSQQSPRMDEEGLLVELVSQYLADRACLTKWDKQRYLPQLTKFISTTNFPASHSCATVYSRLGSPKYCANSKYRTIDGFCNNIYHPYWGKSNVCHIRLLHPDYADGISAPRVSHNYRVPLPNPRIVSNNIHGDVPLPSPYNLLKMQWGQFINHDITNTALSSYDGLIDCCKNPNSRGCYPIMIPPGDPFYGRLNVTCLNFIRSGVCPLCQLGPRQQTNKNTAFLDLSQVYGNTQEQANQLRTFTGGLLKFSQGKDGEILLPLATGNSGDQCAGTCFVAGDNRVNQHPALTALHTVLLRRHNQNAQGLAYRHPEWNDEYVFQEARRLTIAEYQMITFAEYLPIVFGPFLSAYYHLIPNKSGYTYYNPKADPTTWNEYATASCRFGHSQISSTFGLYTQILAYGQKDAQQFTFPLKDWYMRPTLLSTGLTKQLINGLVGHPAEAVDPWLTKAVTNHLYQSQKDSSGGDLAATNIVRAREHAIPGYIFYLDYCFNYKVTSWKDLALFIPYYPLNQLRKTYKVVENIDLFAGGLSERHFPGADIGPTFACINGIQYYHLKFGDRYYFEHGGQAGSFTPVQLDEIKKSTLARLLCRTAYLPVLPVYAFMQPSQFNPLVNCSSLGDIDYNKF